MMLQLAACNQSKYSVDLQGHRGCRGVLPENTIEGFVNALQIGVTTLEMDLVISKDKKVVVSHEPFFSYKISTAPNGEEITEANEKQHNLYQMPYEEIKRFDVGMRPHPDFPSQQKLPAYKPLFSEAVQMSEQFVAKNGLKKPFYNIEIKRQPELDSLYTPPVEEFVRLVLEQVDSLGIKGRVCIQSFDPESLRLVKKMSPELTTALLIYNEKNLEDNIQNLGFVPDIYSPYFELVNQKTMEACKEKGMKVIPWTVNEAQDVLKMLELHVDGIITDYPDIVKNILEKERIAIE